MAEKLDSHIPQFRIGGLAKLKLQKRADEDHRSLTEYIRMKLEIMVKDDDVEDKKTQGKMTKLGSFK